MDTDDAGGPGERAEPMVNAFQTRLEADGASWRVLALYDGEWRTVSTHPSREMAVAASLDLNESANRDPGDLQP